MKGLPFVLAFTAMTFIAWGAYGPLLHHGTLSMGKDSLRAFVGVGIAYFFIAVLVPIYILRSQGENGKWTVTGTFYSLIAGSVGALGALGVILALAYGGKPIYVMPLVFGFAPIVNTLVTAWMSKTFDQISPIFIGGILVAALGVGGVLAFKPAAPTNAHPTSESKDHTDTKPTKDDHSQLAPRVPAKFVTTVLIQDPLPPIVVQPAPPESKPEQEPAPKPIVTPEPSPKEQPQEPAPEPALPKVDEPQELPPVVIQPAPPADEPPANKPASNEPPANEPQVASPSAIVPQTEKPKTEEKPAVEVPKTETLKSETPATPATAPQTETLRAEQPNASGAKPEDLKTVEVKAKPNVFAPAKTSDEETKPAESSGKPSTPPADVPMIVLSIVVAAICWGSYGPMLHQGQAKMSGSRLRPFTCVGIAYFVIAVAAPLILIGSRTADTGSWSAGGLTWSIIAGAAGAIGALGVILAFNAGGKPFIVMPLVFGFAPVINTCISLTETGTWGLVKPMFWVSLAVVIAGAITVLLNAPKPKHTKPAT